jgi:NAD(P)H-nitrite reductase large subunit
MSEEHVIIIGNGISGITAARHIRKLSNKRITVISNESEHFFSRTALMYIYMGHMNYENTKPYEDWFWEKNRIDLKKGYVQSIDSKSKRLLFENNETLTYDKLVIAAGSKPNKFGWPGQNLNGVQGLYHLQDLNTLERHAPNNKACKRAVIVGGGLIGIELAEMLVSRSIPVTFLVREQSFWNAVLPSGESEMLNRHIKNHHIDLRLGVNLEEIKGDEHGKVKSIIIKETKEEITCDLVGLTAGVSPNVDFLNQSEIATNRGILVNRFLETNIEDTYAIGDCAEQSVPINNREPIEATWHTGRIMGETLARTICGNPTVYNPSHWFNSSKFLDIEYQTYGWVNANPTEPNRHFHWIHEDDTKCITVEYNGTSGKVQGINAFGIRLRHEVMDKWLTENQDLDFVIRHLDQANFDPEFYRRYENEIRNQYKLEFS